MSDGHPRNHIVVRAANAAGRALERIGFSPRSLDPQRAVDKAQRKAGLDDFGPGGWQEGLERLAASFDRDARLTPVGRGVAAGLMAGTLEQRLRIVAELGRLPEVAGEEIVRPLFVVGLPRTGSTLLLNLLALADDARPLRWYEATDPISPPGAADGPLPQERDPRFRKARRALSILYRLKPGLRAVHDVEAGAPEECLRLMMRSLVTWTFPVFAEVTSYADWLWTLGPDELEPSYRFHAAQLRLLQHGDGRAPESPPQRWVLKSPVHTNSLHAILRVYPDACLVQTHRALDRVLPSACSLIHGFHSLVSDDVDPLREGRLAMTELHRYLARNRELRAQLPPGQLVDCEYKDLVADPVAAVTRIHRHFGLDVTDSHRDAMRAHLERRPKNRHGVHRYSLEQFGLDPSELAAAQREVDGALSAS